MSPVDIIFAVLLAYAMLRGYSKGLLGTAATYVAPVLAFMIAADWSDPVRERIAAAMPAPDFVLDILAPLVVFIVVVVAVRLTAAFLARLLGVGLSPPSRIVAGAAGGVVLALVLGSLVLVVREMRPVDISPRTDAGDVLVGPLEKAVADLDRRFSESILAPPMADLAAVVVSEAVTHSEQLPGREEIEAAARKAGEAAAAAIGRHSAQQVHPRRPDSDRE